MNIEQFEFSSELKKVNENISIFSNQVEWKSEKKFSQTFCNLAKLINIIIREFVPPLLSAFMLPNFHVEGSQ